MAFICVYYEMYLNNRQNQNGIAYTIVVLTVTVVCKSTFSKVFIRSFAKVRSFHTFSFCLWLNCCTVLLIISTNGYNNRFIYTVLVVIVNLLNILDQANI